MTPPSRDPNSLPPDRPEAQDNRKAFGLAVGAHVLLVLVLVLGLDWHTENPGPVQVELWTDGVSPDARPPEPEVDPTPAPAPQPAPTPPPAPPQ
ncbi:MAG: protein TolA, partial [Comamonadaceae bacterium]